MDNLPSCYGSLVLCAFLGKRKCPYSNPVSYHQLGVFWLLQQPPDHCLCAGGDVQGPAQDRQQSSGGTLQVSSANFRSMCIEHF